MTAYVLVVRHPEHPTEIDAFGAPVRVVHLDLGAEFDGTPDDAQTALRWTRDVCAGLNDIDVDEPIFQAVIDRVKDVVDAYPRAVLKAERYRRWRVHLEHLPMDNETPPGAW